MNENLILQNSTSCMQHENHGLPSQLVASLAILDPENNFGLVAWRLRNRQEKGGLLMFLYFSFFKIKVGSPES